MKQALFCWSGGKDSALALYTILQKKEYHVNGLFTVINKNFHRVSMHGVKEEMIEKQAQSIGLPLHKLYVKEGSNAEYERNMETFLLQQKAQGIHHVIFGDIFLEDLRAYRDANLAKVNMQGVYPLWKQDTRTLADTFIKLKFKTRICCVNDAYLDKKHAGQVFSHRFLKTLPPQVDPCGENGEFHTFCYNGPLFKTPIHATAKQKIYKPMEIKTATPHPLATPASRPKTQGFWFCEMA